MLRPTFRPSFCKIIEAWIHLRKHTYFTLFQNFDNGYYHVRLTFDLKLCLVIIHIRFVVVIRTI